MWGRTQHRRAENTCQTQEQGLGRASSSERIDRKHLWVLCCLFHVVGRFIFSKHHPILQALMFSATMRLEDVDSSRREEFVNSILEVSHGTATLSKSMPNGS